MFNSIKINFLHVYGVYFPCTFKSNIIVQKESYLASSSLVLRKFNMGTKASGSLSINIYLKIIK